MSKIWIQPFRSLRTSGERGFVSLHDEEDGPLVVGDLSQLVQVKMNEMMKLK